MGQNVPEGFEPPSMGSPWEQTELTLEQRVRMISLQAASRETHPHGFLNDTRTRAELYFQYIMHGPTEGES